MDYETEMLNEEYGDFANEDDYDGSSYNQVDEHEIGYAVMSDSSSLSYEPRNKNKNRDAYESTDKNRHKLIRNIKNKKTEIIVYTSPICPGTCIRDAITGTKYSNYLVGSVNEHQFFKVKFATGEMGKDSGCCFFDSPEQYEKHMHQTISNEQKDTWANKCASVRALREN